MSEKYDLPGKAYDAFKKITPKATSKQFTQLGKIARREPTSIVDLIGQEAARQRLASKPQSVSTTTSSSSYGTSGQVRNPVTKTNKGYSYGGKTYGSEQLARQAKRRGA